MPPGSRDPQLLKGVLPTLVLSLLDERESYGYELVTRLQAAGLADIATGTLYPVLARLERDGLVDTRLVQSSSGPARRYYVPTAAGRTALAEGHRTWTEFSRMVTGMLAHLDPPEVPR